MTIRIGRTTDHELLRRARPGERGVALLTALIITLVVFLLVGSVWYATMRATRMSSPIYADACAAADGAIQLTKDAINQAVVGEPAPSIFTGAFAGCLQNNIFTVNSTCTSQLTLAGASSMSDFTANVTLTPIFQGGVRLATKRFPPVPIGNTNAVFYRIVTVVTGPGNTRCENAVVYRNVQ